MIQLNQSTPEVVYRQNKPVAVILDINIYQDMLERLEDAEDLKMLKEMRSQPLEFRKFDDFLAEYESNV